MFGLLETLETAQLAKASRINDFKEIGWLDPFPVDLSATGKKLVKKATMPNLALKALRARKQSNVSTESQKT